MTLFEDRPLVYVAGPYTRPDPPVNVRNAVIDADQLNASGLVTAFVPHLTILWQMICPHEDIDYWYSYDMTILRRSDALYRLPGDSTGADAEVKKAESWNIPVFYSKVDVLTWAVDR
jgi:hypothetical protein